MQACRVSLSPWAVSLTRRCIPRGLYSYRVSSHAAASRRHLVTTTVAGATSKSGDEAVVVNGAEKKSRGGGGGGAAASEGTQKKSLGHGGKNNNKRDLDEALGEVRTILLDPNRLVRAVAGGAARGAKPEWRKLEMRPVALKKGGIKLQVVKYDQRQAFTSNHAYGNNNARRGGRGGGRGGGGGGGGGRKGAEALSANEAADEALREGFKTWRVETAEEVLQLQVTKSGEALVSRARQLLGNAKGKGGGGGGGGSSSNIKSHDRVKERLLAPSDPFLVHVGVSTADGSDIKASRRDKYKQVEAFLRLVEVAVNESQIGGHLRVPSKDAPMRLVDLGCGNAYLTFGAYAFLAVKRGTPLEVVGVDVKRQSRETNSRVAGELGWADACAFVEGTIADAELSFPTPRPGEQEAEAEAAAEEQEEEREGEWSSSPASRSSSSSSPALILPEVDIALALHACDTATDEALVRAVRWRAPLVLVAPCCHHNLQVRMRNATKQTYPPLTRHGILRERLGDVVTDAFRAHILRLLGHRVDVMEWIGGEHTPRNTMIRAINTGSRAGTELWDEYDVMCKDWGVTPWLAEALEPELKAAREAAFAAAAAAGGGGEQN